MNRDALEALIEEYLIDHEGQPTSWTTEWIVDLLAANPARHTPDPTPCDCGIECACATNRKDAS